MTLAEQFKQEGKLEASKVIAMNLFNQGMTVAQVATVTGLSVMSQR